MDLFRHQAKREHRGEPLAERVRPDTLDSFFGQQHLLSQDKLLRQAIANDRVPSLLLWGPPGTGKTTLARIIAQHTGARFVTLSAVGAGVKDLRAAIEQAAEQRDLYGHRTILFVDEIHRFNKAQQDALLPHVEAGTVVLIGATTENPSFEVIAALLSRVRVLRLEALAEEALLGIMRRALAQDPLLRARQATIQGQEFRTIARAAQGDARRALNALELCVDLVDRGGHVTPQIVEQALQQKTLLYDKSGDEHYNVISAFIKSLRGSDPDAAAYWMVRMLEAGEDPTFIVRRMVIFAAEDIGNADPQALQLAAATLTAVRLLGLPEGVLPMTQACCYLATAPKSNAALQAYKRARADVEEHGPLAVPLHLRNAPTRLMREAGYGRDYRDPHDFEGHHLAERYLPDALAGRRYYEPTDQGFEGEIGVRLAGWRSRPAPEPPPADREGPRKLR